MRSGRAACKTCAAESLNSQTHRHSDGSEWVLSAICDSPVELHPVASKYLKECHSPLHFPLLPSPQLRCVFKQSCWESSWIRVCNMRNESESRRLLPVATSLLRHNSCFKWTDISLIKARVCFGTFIPVVMSSWPLGVVFRTHEELI